MKSIVVESSRPSRPDTIGRYRVVDRIGRGAMGVVYAAHDDLMGRDVAVKVMMADLEGEPDIRARFMREAQVSARLTHRNIVTVFDIGEDNGRLFIVMELLRGQTLAECLKQRTLSIEEKVDLTLEVCDGLAVASAAGVCHRDIKPGNLFLQADGGVKILDFGIARLASSSMTASGFIVGTPDYMSPEQARGTAVDERSDIFSVAAVLYFMLAGRKPFVAPDLPAVLHKVVSEDPPPLEASHAPPALSRIVFKALAKDPAQRFQKFPEFAAELSRWRRRYEIETRTLAEEAARSFEQLRNVIGEERQAAEALGVPLQDDPGAWLAEIAAGYPEILDRGADALRSGQWHRHAVEEVARRIKRVSESCGPRIAGLRGARTELDRAGREMEAGNARAALEAYDIVLRLVPGAASALSAKIDRASRAAAEQQARESRVRSLLVDAAEAHGAGRLEAAHTLASEALGVDAGSVAARQLLARVQEDMANAEAEKLRRCERALDRARRALQLEQLDEAERQVRLAEETGASHPDIAIVRSALADARSAREAADALTQEIAAELARARTEFHEGDRAGALARLESLAGRHPLSAAAAAELSRLKAEHDRLTAIERAHTEAERLATEAAAALAANDHEKAMRLADEALALIPSHELALRTSAMAHAHLREVAEREARLERARRLEESARAHLARGRFDRAIKDARQAAELDPAGTAAPGLIAEAFQRQSEEAAREAQAKEAARRGAEMREMLAAGNKALRNKEFPRARSLGEQALALDPDSSEARDFIGKVAAAAALAASTLEDETVDLQANQFDPEATAVFTPVSEGVVARWGGALHRWFDRVRAGRGGENPRSPAVQSPETVGADVAAGVDPDQKEA